MFNHNIVSFIIRILYVLLAVNTGFIVLVLALGFKAKTSAIGYKKRYGEIQPTVISYIKQGRYADELMKLSKDPRYQQIIVDIILEYGEKYGVNVSEQFEELGYVDRYLRSVKRKFNLQTLKTLVLMRSNKPKQLLLEGIKVNKPEIKYLCHYGLSLLSLEDEERGKVLDQLFQSNVMRDRITDIIENYSLSTEQCISLLSSQGTEIRKVVLLQSLRGHQDISEDNADKIFSYVNDPHLDVRIAAITAVTRMGIKKHLSVWKDMFLREESWEVRAMIARSMRHYKDKETIEILKTMVYDANWRVRFNAMGSITYFGTEGIQLLIDLSLDQQREKTASLAYHFLDSSKEINEIVKKY